MATDKSLVFDEEDNSNLKTFQPTKEDSAIDNFSNINSVSSGEESNDDEILLHRSSTKRATIISDDEDERGENKKDTSDCVELRKESVVSDDGDELELFDNLQREGKKRIINDCSDDEDIPATDKDNSIIKNKIQYRSDVFDTQSSDEEDGGEASKASDEEMTSKDNYEHATETFSPKKKKPSKNRVASQKARKLVAQEIHSESQRLMRESEIVLPYHKPKQRSLQEFLNRKKYATPIGKGSLKMSMKDINLLRELEERRDSIDKFYKSESDEESDAEEIRISKEEKEHEEESEFKPDNEQLTEDHVAPLTDNPIKNSTDDINNDDSNEAKITNQEQENDVSPFNTEVDHNSVCIPHDDTIINQDLTLDENECLSENDHETEDLVLHLDTEDFLEEITSKKVEEKSLDKITKSDFNTPKLKLLASKFPDLDFSKLANTTPKLTPKGNSEFVDLDDPLVDDCGSDTSMTNLIGRFVKHSTTRRKPVGKHQQKLEIISKEKDECGEEKLVCSNILVNIEGEDEMPREHTPGAQLVKLKNALKVQLLQQREKERLRRVKEKQFLESEEVIRDDDDILPNEEDEMTDQSETDIETESEPEENDVLITDKIRKRNMFLDDEADEEDRDDDGGISEEDNNQEECEEDDDKVSLDSSCDENDELKTRTQSQRKRLLRIEDDDDNDSGDGVANDNKECDEASPIRYEVNEGDGEEGKTEKINSITSIMSTEDLFSTQDVQQLSTKDKSFDAVNDQSFEFDGSAIPAYQPGGGFRGGGDKSVFAEEIPSNDDSFLCGDDIPNITNKLDKNISIQFTPYKESQRTTTAALVKDSLADAVHSQEDVMDELLGLCSGRFTTSNDIGTENKAISNLCEDVEFAPTQNINEILGLCSGKFSSPQKEKNSEKDDGPENDDSSENNDNNSEDESKSSCGSSPVKRKRVLVYSSDEEGILERQQNKIHKKRRIKDYYSSAKADVEYDDEENAIPKKKSKGFKVNGAIRAEFLEREAELSGSEESEDEEEPDEANDFMELEEGDAEKFDEEELREQVGRAHLKSVIDNDKRELRLLQEMYFEDGDLHGEGRQRKFRWKNVAGDESCGDNTQHSDGDDADNMDEEQEEDAELRKQRFEREKFLQEQKQNDVIAEKILPFKSPSLKIVRSHSLKSKNRAPSGQGGDNAAQSGSSLSFLKDASTKRGSFMARDNVTLKRLAEMTKENNTVGGAKQSGNFVFQTLSAEEFEMKKIQNKPKINAKKNTPIVKKSRSFFSMDENSQSSSIFKHF